jgi:zinc transport system substrate-binding protein
MTRCGIALVLLALTLLAPACGPDDDAVEMTPGKPVVYTTFYPTTYFVERIGGDLVDVVCPLPAGEDAIFWQPDDATLRKYQTADLVVVNGAEFEKWLMKVSLPEARVVDSAARLPGDLLEYADAFTHSHGPAGEHAHEGIDGHTWVDPLNAARQAEAICEGLKVILAGHEAALEERCAALVADLEALDAELRALTETYGGQTILASHPAYNYLVRTHGWNVVNLDLDPETMPDEESLGEIGAIVEESEAKFLVWESPPRPEIAKKLEDDLGLKSVVFSPCEQPDDSGDYLAVMKRNVRALEPVLTGR